MNFGRFLRGLTEQGSVIGSLEKDVFIQVGPELVEPAEIRNVDGKIVITLKRLPSVERRQGARARKL